MTERHPGPTASRVVRATRKAAISARAGQRRLTPCRFCPVSRDNGCPQPGPPGLRVAIRVLERLARPVTSSFGRDAHRPWPSWPTTPARERSGWAGKSGRSRACSGLTSIGRSRRTTQRSRVLFGGCGRSGAFGSSPHWRKLRRERTASGRVHRLVPRRALWRFRRTKALRALRTPGPFTRVRAEASTGSHASPSVARPVGA